jgi:hypothetical protein
MKVAITLRTAICRGLVLDALQDGPYQFNDLLAEAACDEHKFTRQEVIAVGKWLNVETRDLDGLTYWIRPSNVEAIWWKRGLRWHGDAEQNTAAAL